MVERLEPETVGKDLDERSSVGAWYFIDESKTGWSAKFSRPWLVIDTSGPGPFLEVMPHTTRPPRSRGPVRHRRHDHTSGDRDADTCRMDRDGWIVPDERQVIPRKWVERPRSYSCREPDEVLLKRVGCQP